MSEVKRCEAVYTSPTAEPCPCCLPAGHAEAHGCVHGADWYDDAKHRLRDTEPAFAVLEANLHDAVEALKEAGVYDGPDWHHLECMYVYEMRNRGKSTSVCDERCHKTRALIARIEGGR